MGSGMSLRKHVPLCCLHSVRLSPNPDRPAPGVVDIITYAVSIYAQSHIDTTSDVRSMARVAMYSASFGAISLITMCLVLSCIVGRSRVQPTRFQRQCAQLARDLSTGASQHTVVTLLAHTPTFSATSASSLLSPPSARFSLRVECDGPNPRVSNPTPSDEPPRRRD